MQASRAVVLVMDRLGAGWLGPYGNTWLDTPGFNRLAADALLIETAMSDSPELGAYYRGLWSGSHALRTGMTGEVLAAAAQAAGGSAILLTDEAEVSEHPLAQAFGERRLLHPTDAVEPTQKIEETGLYQFFDAAQQALEQFTGAGLLWLHARGMAGAWDAPLELRYQFADELDPEPPSFVVPPKGLLPEHHDPDELLGVVQAYAGQVALADMCLGAWLHAFEAHPSASETLLMVTSPRGYPLGEHRRVGPGDDALYGELLQVPVFLRVPGQEPGRLQRIVQPRDLYTKLGQACGWFMVEGEKSDSGVSWPAGSPESDVAYAAGQDQAAIRTRAWFLRRLRGDRGWHDELFAKPDDRWEANEIASRCSDVVELLAAQLNRFSQAGDEAAASAGGLPEVLCDLWR